MGEPSKFNMDRMVRLVVDIVRRQTASDEGVVLWDTSKAMPNRSQECELRTLAWEAKKRKLLQMKSPSSVVATPTALAYAMELGYTVAMDRANRDRHAVSEFMYEQTARANRIDILA